MTMRMREQRGRHEEQLEQCVESCLDCHSLCLQTIRHCLEVGGKHAEPAHIRILTDCAEICQTSANFMLRGAELHGRTCSLCAEICVRCAHDCARLGPDPMLLACSEACRRCADACLHMVTRRAE